MLEEGLSTADTPEALYLQPFTVLEENLKVQRLNLENNKKEIK